MCKWKSTVLAILLAVSLGIVPFTIESAIAAFPDGTTAYWPLDDAQQTAPGVFVEEIGIPLGPPSPIDGVCAPGIGDVGCPTALAVGQVGGAQTFVGGGDGANDTDGIDVDPASLPDLPADASFSIALWIKRDNLTPVGNRNELAISQDDSPGLNTVHWWIGLDTLTDPANPVAGLVFSDNDVQGTADPVGLLGTLNLNDGAWHHLVGVLEVTPDPIDPPKKILLYVDGGVAPVGEVFEKDVTGLLENPDGFASTEPLNIGYMDFQGNSRFHFPGDIDEVAFFNKALTPAEVTELYNLGVAGTSLRAAVVPTAVDDDYVTLVDTALTELAPGVLDNDTTGTTSLTAINATDPPNGTVVLDSDGSFTYTPDPGFIGDDTFTYTARDATETDSAPATVTITVSATPVAVDDNYTTTVDTALNEPAITGVLANDTPAAARTVSLDTDVSNGALTLNADGSFAYTPNLGFTGADSFIYTFNDGVADSNVATVTITVGLVAVDDNYSTAVGTLLDEPAPGVLANDTPGTTAVLVDNPTDGVVVLNPDGSFVYTPNPLFDGTDTFTYTANAGGGASNVATVTIDVSNPIPPIVRGGGGGGGGCFIMTAGD